MVSAVCSGSWKLNLLVFRPSTSPVNRLTINSALAGSVKLCGPPLFGIDA